MLLFRIIAVLLFSSSIQAKQFHTLDSLIDSYPRFQNSQVFETDKYIYVMADKKIIKNNIRIIQNQKKKNYMDAIVKLQDYLCPCVDLFENAIQEKRRFSNNKKIKKNRIEIHPLYLGSRETLFIKMYQNNLISAYRFLKEGLGVCECETIN